MGTVSNLVNDHFRGLYQTADSPIYDELPDAGGNPSLILENNHRREIVQWGLRQLPPSQQHVLTLRFGVDCSLAETAKIMGKTPNAVKQLQYRALAALRKQIEGKL